MNNRVRRAFERGAATYDQHAVLQKQVAAEVEQLCLQHSPPSCSESILDLGAGTGYLTTPLLFHYPRACVTALDISQNMLNSIPEHRNLHKVRADFMALPFAAERFDLVSSSLALQWGGDLSVLLAGIKKVLRDDGRIVFSTLLDGSLFELRNSWRAIDDAPHINQFISKSYLQRCLVENGLKLEKQRQENISLHYDSAIDVLKAIKGIGANTVMTRTNALQGLGGRQRIKNLTLCYEKYRNEAGLPLSYSVCWLVLSKN